MIVGSTRMAQFRRNQSGQGMFEYVAILAFVAIVVIGTLAVLGGRTSATLCQVGTALGSGGGVCYANLMTNPSFENDIARWNTTHSASTTMTVTRQSSWSTHGDWSERVTSTSIPAAGDWIATYNPPAGRNGFPVTGGADYYSQADVNIYQVSPTNPRIILLVQWYTSAGASAGSHVAYNNTAVSTGVLTLSGVSTAPASAAYGFVEVRLYGNAGETVDFAVDSAMATQSDSAIPYFDGDSPNGAWSGATGDSTSTAYITS
jgi:Flp pilus assembly pilin Flp